MKQELKENKPASNHHRFTFFLIGLFVINGGLSILLFLLSKTTNLIEIESLWATWWFAMVILCGIPITLIVDAFIGTAYEVWGTPITKYLFLFIAKVVESLLLITIVYLADEWNKGLNCSMWSEILIGYGFFLLLEGIFSFGNYLEKRRHVAMK